MLWEISILNKIFKTSAFSSVRARMAEDQLVYVVSSSSKQPKSKKNAMTKGKKPTGAITRLQEGDLLLHKSLADLLATYGLEHLKDDELYSMADFESLYMYDCFVYVAERESSDDFSPEILKSIRRAIAGAYENTHSLQATEKTDAFIGHTNNTLLY